MNDVTRQRRAVGQRNRIRMGGNQQTAKPETKDCPEDFLQPRSNKSMSRAKDK